MLFGVVAACTPEVTAPHPQYAEAGDAPVQPLPPGWPTELLVGPGRGPALFTGYESTAPGFAYLTEGTVVHLAGAPLDGRIPVKVDGPLKLRGYFPIARLAARVQRHGRVRGTPISVGAGDIVGVRGVDAEGRITVEVMPRIPGVSEALLAHYDGSYPAVGLGITMPAPEPRDATESFATLPVGHAITVRDRADGQVLTEMPAPTSPVIVTVVRNEDGWSAVRIGQGPYLTGFVHETLAPTTATPTPIAEINAHCEDATPPARMRFDASAEVIRLRAGTRLRLRGKVFGVVRAEAEAHVIEHRENGELDVFVALDDSSAMRGLVHPTDIVGAPDAPPAAADDDSEN